MCVIQLKMKKALRETQTLRAGYGVRPRKAEPKIYTRPQTLFLGERDGQNQLEIVTTFTHKPSLVSIYTRNLELS